VGGDRTSTGVTEPERRSSAGGGTKALPTLLRAVGSRPVGQRAVVRDAAHAKPALDEDADPGFHISFGVADRSELEKWASRLDELGVDHDEIKDASYGSGLSFRDPDGIALEFFCAPAA
jgi:catechol 2,3-dioxygenase-like lactoylglutathione lyase family enzyme